MYLSRIQLDQRTAGRVLSGGAYRLHQKVWDLFSDGPQRRRDFLYRLDLSQGRPQLFSLSRRPPRLQDLGRVETKAFEPQLAAGDRLRFRLRVNPVVKKEGKRHDVVMDAKQRLRASVSASGEGPNERETSMQVASEAAGAWLEGRASGWGFRLLPGLLRLERYDVERFSKGRSGRQISVAFCDFAGILEVVDPTIFTAALAQGFGAAKGFGGGLMLIARYRGGPA